MWMRIPTSTIVMSLVAAVPFGLAIRDTIQHRDRLQQLADEEREQRVREAAEREADAASQEVLVQQLEREQRARNERVEQHASLLVGHEFVTPGLAYHGAAIGDSPRDGVDTIVDASGNTLAMSAAMSDDDVACGVLREVATRTWGEPANDHVWLALGTHVRAAITPDCALEFARFAEPAAWVKDLPLDAIGKSRQELARRFAAHGDPDPDAAWYAPGLDGDELSRLWPVYDVAHPDKLLGMQIATPATRATADRVVEQLATRLHAKPTKTDDNIYLWRHPIEMRVEYDDNKLVIDLGPDAVR